MGYGRIHKKYSHLAISLQKKQYILRKAILDRKDMIHYGKMFLFIRKHNEPGYQNVSFFENGLKRVLKKRLRRRVKVAKMQFEFVLSRSTVDAIFVVKIVQKNYLFGNRELYICLRAWRKFLIECQ